MPASGPALRTVFAAFHGISAPVAASILARP